MIINYLDILNVKHLLGYHHFAVTYALFAMRALFSCFGLTLKTLMPNMSVISSIIHMR